MKDILIATVGLSLAFTIAATIDSAQRDLAKIERNHQEQQVAAWEREQFEGSIQKAARDCSAIRVRCSGPWMILEGQMAPGGPWLQLGRVRASVWDGDGR